MSDLTFRLFRSLTVKVWPWVNGAPSRYMFPCCGLLFSATCSESSRESTSVRCKWSALTQHSPPSSTINWFVSTWASNKTPSFKPSCSYFSFNHFLYMLHINMIWLQISATVNKGFLTDILINTLCSVILCGLNRWLWGTSGDWLSTGSTVILKQIPVVVRPCSLVTDSTNWICWG